MVVGNGAVTIVEGKVDTFLERSLGVLFLHFEGEHKVPNFPQFLEESGYFKLDWLADSVFAKSLVKLLIQGLDLCAELISNTFLDFLV